ncbi:MAG: response regulator [Blastocatellia bacterium]
MSKKIRVVIADDHPVYRRGLGMVIAADPLIELVAEAEDGAAALARIREVAPDVAVLDVDMPHKGGFDVVRELQKLNLRTEVIFLTMYKDEGLFNTAMDLGVKGYILKDSAITDIVAGIKAVADGQNYISAPLATYLVNRSQRRAAFAQHKPSINDLTPTERRILKLIAEHKTSREIAEELFISVRTVERHRLNICTKLDLHGSNALLKFALENKQQLL